jgi:hypothetical protein
VDHAAALEQQAIGFAKRGEFGSEAKLVNEELTRLAPANQGAWTRLARCCLELGQLDDATAALDAVLQLNPQNTIARNLQGEVTRRRAGPAADVAPRRRHSRSSGSASSRGPAARMAVGSRPKAGTLTLAGIGRAEFTALGHLPPAAAAESLTPRVEPLLMALNDRPFAARVVEARNRAGHAGARLFRRGSIEPGSAGHIHVSQQGGRWEPQLHLGLFAAPQWGCDAVAAGIGFNLAEGGTGDRADAGRERVFKYFEVFQQLVSSTWRQHLSDWMRASGGFLQYGNNPPATDLLPYAAVDALVSNPGLADSGWVFVGRWLFADRTEDVATMIDATRLVRWIEHTFTDLLPLWGTVYRDAR